tara:strand:- start:703 stop:933 length:231 start_codon:yes stop_codon:yes gene_type:complete
MEILHASLLSGSVIMYQLILGFIQLVGYGVGGRLGGIVAFIMVAIWTFTQTWGNLFVLQMVVQGGIAIFLFNNVGD